MEKTLGQVLREGRQALKLTQRKAAEKLKCSDVTVSQIENGTKPSAELLRRCSHLYGIPFPDLVNLKVADKRHEFTEQERNLL